MAKSRMSTFIRDTSQIQERIVLGNEINQRVILGKKIEHLIVLKSSIKV